MTWQKITAVETETGLKVQYGENGQTHNVENAVWGDRPTYTLENKSGKEYDLVSFPGASLSDEGVQMAEDIAETLQETDDVWGNVNFGDNLTYIQYWSEGAPWNGGVVHDDYGFAAME